MLAGPLPKPLGGVSVHTYRLFNLLKNKGYDISLSNLNRTWIKGSQWVLFLIKIIFIRFDVIHLQAYESLFYPFILFICKIKRTRLILTLHNPEYEPIKKKYLTHLNRTDLVIAVGKHIIDEYEKQGVKFKCKIKIINPYLPPNENDRASIENTYSKELTNFIKSKDKLILVSAFKLLQVDNNIDLYGIDKSIKLLFELKKQFKSIGLIIAIADDSYNRKYLTSLKNEIKSLNLFDSIFFIEGQKEIWPLFNKINLFLRPTYFDGYGISVAEALHFNCKSLASDVCIRAEGAMIYKYSDFNDFKTKALTLLKFLILFT